MTTTLHVRIPLGALAPTVDHLLAHEPTDLSASSHGPRLAVCDATGLLAVANGRGIDLYHADAVRCADHRDETTAPLAENHDAHLPFAGQIVLGDHLDAYLDGQSKQQRTADGAVYATCVAFAAPGFLLVAASVLDGASSSSWLCGFRMYSRSVTSTPRYGPSSLLVHCAFVDRVQDGCTVVGVETIPLAACASQEAGAATLLLRGDSHSSSFGVFQWAERFSDRVLSLARLPGTTSALAAVAVSQDARWMAISDESGATHLLDFGGFNWQIHQTIGSQPLNQASGKRLVLGKSYRLGRESPRNHPLDSVRLVSQARVGAAGSFGTSLRWWRPQLQAITKQYLLLGQSDGALMVMVLKKEASKYSEQGFALKTVEIYPAIRSVKNDPLLRVTEPTFDTTTNLFSFSSISRTSWRQWTISLMQREQQDRVRLQWPTLRDSLSLRTLQLDGQDLHGTLMLSRSSMLAIRFTEMTQNHVRSTTQWLLQLNHDGIRAIAYVNLVNSNNSLAEDMVKVEPLNESPLSTPVEAADQVELEKVPAESCQDPIANTKPTALTTLQDRYKLPPMPYREASHASSQSDSSINSSFSQPSQRLTKDEYNSRLIRMARRVDRLNTNLHTLRSSFQLFTDDVQRHMTFISSQLEEMSDRCVRE